MKKMIMTMGLAAMAVSNVSVADDTIKIGVAVYGLQGEFMQLWSKAAKNHPMVKSGDVELTIFDGRYDALVQENQFDTMITRQFDAIIFVPVDANACASAVSKAAEAGIPVIGSNTRCNTEQLASFVGSNDVKAGEMVANNVLDKIDHKGKVVILEGPIGQSAQIDRFEGIKHVLDSNDDVKVVGQRTANWSRAEALALMENWLISHQASLKGVIAENDEMALGAIEAIKNSGLDVNSIVVAGVDGITDALKAVKKNEMETVLQDAEAQAQGAVDVALRHVVKGKYAPQSKIWENYKSELDWNDGMSAQYNIPWTPVTTANVDKLLSARQ
ncbi:substrate-binding domain-containing protein [Marinomonas gallaica]|uniref:substrate-binding domain-containing protein n=1 Tax=Marinomonas gallaica TaxID=1806667 RepID=UPI003A8E3CC7